MVTEDGVVQAGQVCAQTLDVLADSLSGYTCKDAVCFSANDEALIDAAIERMGGYETIDTYMKGIFHDAILSAHSRTARALSKTISFDSWRSNDSVTALRRSIDGQELHSI